MQSYLTETEDSVYAFFFRGGGGEKVNYGQFENGEYVSN